MLLAIFIVCSGLGAPALLADEPKGYVEGHATIASERGIALEGENAAKGSVTACSDCLLIIWSADHKKEIARVTTNGAGNFRIGLPVGAYVLEGPGGGPGPKRLLAVPQPFVIVADQTIRVNMNLELGVRPMGPAPSSQ